MNRSVSREDPLARVRPFGSAVDPRWQRRIVWIGWVGAAAFALAATAVHGRWLPWSDDFDIVPYLTGDKAVTANWLWSQHNEHRIPLVKLLFVGLGRLSGADYRWTLAFNALLLSATAAALIVAAARLRGRAAWTDVLFPAVLLHLGQGALVWAFHSQFLLTTVLGGLFVAVAVAGSPAAPWRAAALAILACLLPLTGSSGLLVSAGAALLLAAEAVWPASAGSPSPPMARGLAAAGAIVTAAVALSYVATLKLGPADGYAGPWQTLVASVDMLSSYPGSPVARMREPWRLATILAIAGTLAAAVPALRRSAAGAPDRRGLVILVGYLACLGLVAAAIGYGRGTRDFTHLYGHYSTLALAIPLALGLVWAALPQTITARGAQAILCLTALVVFTVHARQAVRNSGSGAESWALIATDMRGELPPEEVAARHAASLYFLDTPDVRAKIAACVGMLRRTTFPLYCARPASPEPPSP
jgi:hypothetical protein